MRQINLRLPENLRKAAERYARLHGFRNVQELAMQSIREKVFGADTETLQITADAELMKSIQKGIKGKHISSEEFEKKHRLK